MFCFQCQEAMKNTGCTVQGVCGKSEETAGLQDVLVYSCKGMSLLARELNRSCGRSVDGEGRFILRALFATITNANFDNDRFVALIEEALAHNRALRKELGSASEALGEPATWDAETRGAMFAKIPETAITREENADIRSLRELIIYGLKGIAAYAEHALVLGYEEPAIYSEMINALVATVEERDVAALLEVTLKTGELAVKTMELLDRAHTETYGHPEITTVDLGVGSLPGILVSGHDLKDLEELLEQSRDRGVEIYTHGEMLPAQYYPAFKAYPHFKGNYGNSWWKQGEEFASFNGAILMTTNCITPVRDSYRDRIFTTGTVGYEGVTHIGDRNGSEAKDFTPVIDRALSCDAPTEIETGTLTGGFAHHQVGELASTVVDAVKSGAIRKFVVMAGCDGRHSSRDYFTGIAEGLPQDTVILTAGCAKYRYNKLNLGDIGGIPRVLDAGQCNDSYSLAVTALRLKEAFELEDINELPIEFDIAWYEQKAVAVLLALLSLGFKGIRIGPTLPAFLSEQVASVLVETFDLKVTGEVEEDLAAIAGA
ncbi:MAG: hydroxylamine reductase [Spirochaetaceae bacterium]